MIFSYLTCIFRFGRRRQIKMLLTPKRKKTNLTTFQVFCKAFPNQKLFARWMNKGSKLRLVIWWEQKWGIHTGRKGVGMLPQVELLEPWKTGGLGDLCTRESALLASSCHHQNSGCTGVPSVHQGEFAGKFFSAGFRPFPMCRSAQSHWA